jgi:FixJ family two-component response regulator
MTSLTSPRARFAAVTDRADHIDHAGTIFVVAEDQAVCAAINCLLSAAGHSVRTFYSGAEFLAHTQPPPLVCLEMATVAQRYLSLTPREKQVMVLVTAGLMNKQVAHELNLSLISVKIHRGNLMKKMRARTLPDLVRAAVMLKL